MDKKADLESYKGQHCHNCHSEIVGKFCHVCGQIFYFGEFNVRRTLKYWFAKKFDLIEGVAINTIKMFFLKPGELTKAYIAGQKVRYIDPVKLFLYTTGFFVALVALSHISIVNFEFKEDGKPYQVMGYKYLENCEAQNANYQKSVEINKSKDNQFGVFLAEKSKDRCQFSNMLAKTLNYNSILLIPFSCLTLFAIYFRRKISLLTHLVHVLHLTSMSYLLTVISILIFWFNPKLHFPFSTVIASFIYYILSFKRVYAESWVATVTKSAMSYILFILCSIGTMFLIVSISLKYFAL